MNVRQISTRVDPGQQADLRSRTPKGTPQRPERTSDFSSHLDRAQLQEQGTKISNHAWQRIQQRGISMTETEQRRLAEAVQHLADKGANDALLMRSDAAFVVNVPNRTVVTAVDRQELQQRVFTQIDSAMLLDS